MSCWRKEECKRPAPGCARTERDHVHAFQRGRARRGPQATSYKSCSFSAFVLMNFQSITATAHNTDTTRLDLASAKDLEQGAVV